MSATVGNGRDSFTTLDYADQRYYAFGYGRFNTPDPYSKSVNPKNPGSWNRYGYALGDPVNGNDPRGLEDFCDGDFDCDLGSGVTGGVCYDADGCSGGGGTTPIFTITVTADGGDGPDDPCSAINGKRTSNPC